MGNTTKRRRLRGFDLREVRACHGLIGIDEAGRGALAGPVVAAAVLTNGLFYAGDWCRRHATSINDSKQLSARSRTEQFARMEWLMREHRILFASGVASVAEIESENILGATRLAMRRALEAALALGRIHRHPPDPLFSHFDPPRLLPGEGIADWKVLVDGRPMKSLGVTHKAIVDGDAKSLVIAMASIVAKVTRDRLMEALEVAAPGYGFARHKGYATKEHRDAILALGPSPHHRPLFLRSLLATRNDPGQQSFAFDSDG